MPSSATQSAAHLGVTLASVVHASWALVLHNYTGATDVVFGITTSGRTSTDASDEMIGLLINTLALRAKPTCDMSVKEFVQAVHTNYSNMLAYEAIPLQDIVRWSGYTTLFDTVIASP